MKEQINPFKRNFVFRENCHAFILRFGKRPESQSTESMAEKQFTEPREGSRALPFPAIAMRRQVQRGCEARLSGIWIGQDTQELVALDKLIKLSAGLSPYKSTRWTSCFGE